MARRKLDPIAERVHQGCLHGDTSGHAYYTGASYAKRKEPVLGFSAEDIVPPTRDAKGERECDVCHRPFTPRAWNQKYCIDCMDSGGGKTKKKSHKERKKEQAGKEVDRSDPNAFCKHCGKPFHSKFPRNIFCSMECYERSKSPNPLKMVRCAVCDMPFKQKCGSNKYCSKECLRVAKNQQRVEARAKKVREEQEARKAVATESRGLWRT